MKNLKLILLALAVVIVLGAVVIAGLTGRGEEEAPSAEAPEITAGEAPAESAALSQTPAPVENKTAIPSGSRLNSFEREALAAAQSCTETFRSLDKGGSVNVVLTDQAVGELVQALGAAGYSAVDYFGSANMQNPQPLVELCAQAAAGGEGEAAYYTVYNDGRIIASLLSASGGAAAVSTVSMEWDENNEPRVYSSGQYALAELRCTENSWLVYGRYAESSDGDGEKLSAAPDQYTMVRLREYDSTLRQFEARYLSPGYFENNLFTCSWSSQDYGSMDFNSLYPALHSVYYGTQTLVDSNMSAQTGFKNISGTGLYIVPYSQFEEVMSQYFGIGEERLRRNADNSESYGGYYIVGYNRDYYGVVSPQPEPDIIDYRYNSDGSLTLRINGVYKTYGKDSAFTHELTVMETEDGFRYLSNSMYQFDQELLPELVLRSERKNQIAALD